MNSAVKTKMQHTPGPWHIGPDAVKEVFSATCIVADDIDDAIICSLGHDVPGAEANASLIAAAPMYEALKKIADNYGGCHCDHTTNECCENPAIGEFCPHCIAEIALTKVEGRA